MKLNVGCGKDIRKDCINLDKLSMEGVDKVHDLTKVPYPFKKDIFDVVYLFGVMEHVPDTVKIMEEIHRITKPHAKIYISVPIWQCTNMLADPTHVGFISYNTFDFFETIHDENFDAKARFKDLKVQITVVTIVPEFLRKILRHFIPNVVVRLDYLLETIK